jgi:hypothetical protein
MTETYLGKIESIYFGYGGYQDAEIGLSITFSGNWGGVSWWKGNWSIERSERCKWTDEDRDKSFAELVHFINDTMKKAKVTRLEQLKGKPVEVTIERGTLKDWRILEEVL